ncbi:MAG: glycosyltransferase [Verrucomicrobiota bacterium]
MKVSYLIPPPAKRVGGIDRAIEQLKDNLDRVPGVTIDVTDFPDSDSDLVHCHGLWQSAYIQAAVFCRKRHIPYIVSPHGMMEPWAIRNKRWKKLPYYHLVEKNLLNEADAIFTTSPMEASNVRNQLPNSNICVIPFGIDDHVESDGEKVRKRLGLSGGEKLMLYLSRVDRKKGLDLMLRALREMPSHQGWTLAIVGDGDPIYRRELQSFIKQHRKKLPAIHWIGPVWGAERWDYFHAADLFCLPTHSESFGYAVLEALWAGTPTITTSETPWVDLSNSTGLFIAEDSVDSLKRRLSFACNQFGWTTLDRRTLQKWIRHHFNWDQLTDHYLSAYHAVLAGQRAHLPHESKSLQESRI